MAAKSEEFSVQINLPSRQVGGLLATHIADETSRPYVTNFDDGLTTVTLTSETAITTQKAEQEIALLIRQIQRDITVQTRLLHCTLVPLNEDLIRHVSDVESFYNVEITLTSQRYSAQDISRLIQSLQIGHPLLYTKNLENITISGVPNETHREDNLVFSASPEAQMGQPVWYHYQQGNRVQLSDIDALALEHFLQYGGSHVVVSGRQCVVDFKEMKIMSELGEVQSLERVPPLIGLPQRTVMVNIKGTESCIQGAIANLLHRLNGCLRTISIPYSPIPQDHQYISNFKQQILNYARQYCIICNFPGNEHVLAIKGYPSYLEVVLVDLQEQIKSLERDFKALASSPPPAASDSLSVNELALALPPVMEVVTHSNPPFWSPQSCNCSFYVVSQNSDEWTQIQQQMNATLKGFVMTNLERVQNITLWERYSLEARQMSARNKGHINEKYLYHGTSHTDPYSVAKSESGLDFRYSSRTRGLMWGNGVYFAVNASYSNSFSFKVAGKPGTRKMIVASVLTGYSCPFGTHKDPSLTKPPVRSGDELYDTVNGKTGGSLVYVVYDHFKSYPAYIVTYCSV